MVKDIYLIQNFDILFDSTIVLYGAGKKGNDIYKTLQGLEIKIESFCDSDCSLWGKSIEQTHIISPDRLVELSKEKKDLLIIVTIEKFYAEVIADLENKNIQCPIFTIWGFENALLTNLKNSKITDDFRENYKFNYNLDKVIYMQRWKAFSAEIELRRIKEVIKNKECIWVYHPCKVASTSIVESIKNCSLSVQHIHTLKYSEYFFGNQLREEWKHYIEIIKERGMKIITGVRDPLARDYAVFWQLAGLDRFRYRPYLLNDWQKFYDIVIDFKNETAACLYSEMIRRNEFDWFNEEIRDVLGVDIYAYPFDKEKGYQIIKQGNIEILVLKVEKLNNNSNVIADFIGYHDFKLKRANESNNKMIRYAYEEFKEILKYSSDYVDKNYNSKYFKHFYADNEKHIFLNKWNKNLRDQS